MVLYTIMPPEAIFGEQEDPEKHDYKLEKGAYREYEYGKNGEKKLKNLFSTDPADYLQLIM